ncbi:A24 family peptidase [Streptomyces sp. NBC_00059]|uniref:prepilin peptidase n=1 Tax=Streptomyces sp. NBC_00059 TaxID=2975635 RepID=UPI002254AD90|nr:A24 family peptidase [Streptomyces sp. NBC_00059]MCX5410402.1 A24 family peptidase [Streptomyces sp. NBC_00059]
MDATLIAVAVLWGAAAGLLLPRAAYRFSVEPEEPWRDACPAGHAFTGPARGWLGTARCATCAVTVPALPGAPAPEDPGVRPAPARPRRYAPGAVAPAVTVLACAALAAATGLRPEAAVWLLLAPVAVLLAVIDRRVHRLPDRLTLPLAGAAAVLLGCAALLPEHGGSWTSALLGGAALGGFYFLLFLINPTGMGFGDVKLALALGVALGWYGWAVLCAGGFAGFLFGALYGAGLMLLRRAGRKTGIPFGPFMIAGALVGLLFGGLAA